MVKLRFYLHGVEILAQEETQTVPRKGDHIQWNGTLLEVAMVVWTGAGAVHLYLARDPFNNPLPAGLEEPCDPSSPP
jgi:hypothetical protein